MRLTQWTDYTLRVLMYCAATEGRLQPVTISEVAESYDISRSHLTKVANVLTRAGFLIAVRGRSGGLRMGRAAADITLGEVLRVTEPDFASIECFGPGADAPVIGNAQTGRPAALDQAIRAAIARKPKGHDFDYTRQTVTGQMTRHMSHTGG